MVGPGIGRLAEARDQLAELRHGSGDRASRTPSNEVLLIPQGRSSASPRSSAPGTLLCTAAADSYPLLHPHHTPGWRVAAGGGVCVGGGVGGGRGGGGRRGAGAPAAESILRAWARLGPRRASQPGAEHGVELLAPHLDPSVGRDHRREDRLRALVASHSRKALLLVGEVHVEGCARDAGARDDVGDGGGGIALLGNAVETAQISRPR